MTPKSSIALLALSCLIIPTVFAASLGGALGTPPAAADEKKIKEKEDGPSILISGVVLTTDKSKNEPNTGDAWKERRIIKRTEEKRGLGAFLETVLAIRGTVATGVEGLMNGVVGGLFKGAKPAENGDFS
ncbi:uncharacterized protein [Hetaerina americana]|uniref:uncharacterized protein n=1 Tax=Hetaerina americana TaxID=62018 RepID=UPI003A7F5710